MSSEQISRDQVPEEFRVPKGGFGPIYHATARVVPVGGVQRGTVFEDDEEELTTGRSFMKAPDVHFGTHQAALQRAQDLAGAGSHKDLSDDFFLYEAEIATGASVGPLVHDYTANAVRGNTGYDPKPSDLAKHTAEELAGYDVLPYVNRAEDVGSVSYSVKPSVLKNVVRREEMLNPRNVPKYRDIDTELVRPADQKYKPEQD